MGFFLGETRFVDPNLGLISGLLIHALRVLEQTPVQVLNIEQHPAAVLLACPAL